MKTRPITDFKHLAIIQTAFLGDVALTLPLAQKIRNKFPKVEITFVTTPAASPIVACAEAVNNVVTYDKRGLQSGMKGIKSIVGNLHERKVDCIIAPHRSLRTTLITLLTKPDYSVGFDRNAFSYLYKKRIKYKLNQHEITRNLSLLNSFSDISDIFSYPKVELDIHNADKSYVESKLNWLGISENDIIVAIAPGSVWETKRWNEVHFTDLSKMLTNNGFKVILIGSEADSKLASRISKLTSAFNLAGELTIPQTLHLLSLCSLTVTNDSAPTHFAGLVSCPTLTIYGPTTPDYGFAPIGEFDKVVELSGLKCKPCAIHGSHNCPIKTHDCMEKLMPATVFDECIKILKITGKII